MNEATCAEQASDWVVQANKGTYEQTAQYFRLDFWLSCTIVRWRKGCKVEERKKKDCLEVSKPKKRKKKSLAKEFPRAGRKR